MIKPGKEWDFYLCQLCLGLDDSMSGAYTISDRGVRRSVFLGNKGYGGVGLGPLYSLQLQLNTYHNFKAASPAFL